MMVLVCGGSAISDELKVPRSLDYWLPRIEMRTIVQSVCSLMAPGERLVLRQSTSWAERRRLKVIAEDIPDAQLKRLGPGARLDHLKSLIVKHKPEYLIAFPGTEVAEITKMARLQGVRCVEVA